MPSRRVLVSVLAMVMFAFAAGCGGGTREPYQEIKVPESPQDIELEEEGETDTAPAPVEEEPEADQMAQAEEAEQPPEEPEPTAEATMAPEEPAAEPAEPEPEVTEPAPTEEEQETPEMTAEKPQATPMEEADGEESMAETKPQTPRKTSASQPKAQPAPEPEPAPRRTPPGIIETHQGLAVAFPTYGNQARGWIFFEEVDGGVRVLARIVGLKPNQKHGFHIHEFGDFGDHRTGKTAGGHYDPLNTARHGRPNAEQPHHAGDLGNLQADDDGEANYDRIIKGICVTGCDAPVLGRAVIVHAGPDDFSQPTGNAGPRLAVGVIGVANPD